MTVLQKPYKKKITIPIIPIVEDKEELYADINCLKRDAVDTQHVLLQIPKQEMRNLTV